MMLCDIERLFLSLPLAIFADYQARSGDATLITPVSVTAVKMHCSLTCQTAFSVFEKQKKVVWPARLKCID